MKHVPKTLGEKLAPEKAGLLIRILTFVAFLVFIALPAWWFMSHQSSEFTIMLLILGTVVLLAASMLATPSASQHSLLKNDRQGFMRDLQLDAKTTIFDGSNIYHFGYDNGYDAKPLKLIANQLRTEGYRIVCFFDANIFYTLSEHGAFPTDQQHSLKLIEGIFGLSKNEFYIVPSGVQADRYILNALKHLPISFAISNDKFRDYAKAYPDVMKGNQWRKGVVISKGEVKVLQHRLEAPIKIS